MRSAAANVIMLESWLLAAGSKHIKATALPDRQKQDQHLVDSARMHDCSNTKNGLL